MSDQKKSGLALTVSLLVTVVIVLLVGGLGWLIYYGVNTSCDAAVYVYCGHDQD